MLYVHLRLRLIRSVTKGPVTTGRQRDLRKSTRVRVGERGKRGAILSKWDFKQVFRCNL